MVKLTVSSMGIVKRLLVIVHWKYLDDSDCLFLGNTGSGEKLNGVSERRTCLSTLLQRGFEMSRSSQGLNMKRLIRIVLLCHKTFK